MSTVTYGDNIKMPGGGLPGVGRFTMGGKHNESWCKSKTVLFKCQVIFSGSLKIILRGAKIKKCFRV